MIEAIWRWFLNLFATKPAPTVPVSPDPAPVVPPTPVIPAPAPAVDKYFNKSGLFLINKAGFDLVKHFEGCYLRAYQDSVGVWTLGWGRINYPGGGDVKKGDSCSQEQADAWLLDDMEEEGAHYVRAYAGSGLNENQFSALTSFTYNRGAGRLKQLLNMSSISRDVHRNILSFNWAGNEHKYLLGLDRRRHAERELYLGGDWRKFDSVEKFKKYKKDNS